MPSSVPARPNTHVNGVAGLTEEVSGKNPTLRRDRETISTQALPAGLLGLATQFTWLKSQSHCVGFAHNMNDSLAGQLSMPTPSIKRK
jgi:hypothetical protein